MAAKLNKYSPMKNRRKELMAQMEPNSIALIPAAKTCFRNNDAEYPYRQNSDFYYLTGFPEEDALLALIPGRKQGEVVLFCQEKNKEKELWTGILMGPEAAKDKLGLDDAYPISDIDDILPGLIEGRERVYYSMGKDDKFDDRVMDWVKVIRSKAKLGAHPPGEFLVLDHLLHELRLFKNKAEIDLMERAAKISAEGHRRAMAVCKPGMARVLKTSCLSSSSRMPVDTVPLGSEDIEYRPLAGGAHLLHAPGYTTSLLLIRVEL